MPDKEEKYEVAVVAIPEQDPSPDPTVPKAIVLDLSPVNFLDTVGVKTLRNVRIIMSKILAILVFTNKYVI